MDRSQRCNGFTTNRTPKGFVDKNFAGGIIELSSGHAARATDQGKSGPVQAGVFRRGGGVILHRVGSLFNPFQRRCRSPVFRSTPAARMIQSTAPGGRSWCELLCQSRNLCSRLRAYAFECCGELGGAVDVEIVGTVCCAIREQLLSLSRRHEGNRIDLDSGGAG